MTRARLRFIGGFPTARKLAHRLRRATSGLWNPRHILEGIARAFKRQAQAVGAGRERAGRGESRPSRGLWDAPREPIGRAGSACPWTVGDRARREVARRAAQNSVASQRTSARNAKRSPMITRVRASESRNEIGRTAVTRHRALPRGWMRDDFVRCVQPGLTGPFVSDPLSGRTTSSVPVAPVSA